MMVETDQQPMAVDIAQETQQPIDVGLVLGQQQENTLSVEVDKEALEYDLGNLTAFDYSPINHADLSGSRKAAFLKELARDNTQLLINQLWKIDFERNADVLLVPLPTPTTPLPREKPLPKARPETKWEKFAKARGIVKHKRSRMVFSEEKQDYAPRWGYKRANDDTTDWMKVMPDNASQDPFEDQFAKAKEAKRNRIAKNKRQHEANLQASAGEKMQKARRGQVEDKLLTTKVSTASLGRFDQPIKNEPRIKGGPKGGKKKVHAVAPSKSQRGQEKDMALGVVDRILKKDSSIIDTKKAANRELGNQQRLAANARQGKKKRGGRR